MSKGKPGLGGFGLKRPTSAIEAGRGQVKKKKTGRTSFAVDVEVGARIRDMAHWERRSVVEVVEAALLQYVEQAEGERGEPYPPRPQ